MRREDPEPWGHRRVRGNPQLRCLAVAGVLMVLTLLLSPTHALDEEIWDKPFRNPQYLVYVKETNTERGWEPRDFYLLHDAPPNEHGVIETGDGYGGIILSKGEPAGGPFTTRRQVCDHVKGMPKKQFALGFDCRPLWDLTDCAAICRKAFDHGTWDGESEYPNCDCRCEKGYEYLDRGGEYACVPCDQVCWERNNDPHSIYDPAGSIMNVCACRCETGYDDRRSEKCEKIECGSQATNIVDLQAGSPFFTCPPQRLLSRHCCCDEGAVPWGGVCQKEVDIPPERRQWGAVTPENVKRNVLTDTLRKKKYKKPLTVAAVTYKPKTYPPGTVVFWAVTGTDPKGNPVRNRYAHSSVIVNRDGDQMEMGASQVGTFSATAPPNPPKTNLTNPIYEPCEVWLPPDGTKVKPGAGRLLQMPRGAIPKKNPNEIQKWEWNCHGFVDAVAKVYIAVPDPGAALPPKLHRKGATLVPMKDPPGVPYTLELQQGALYGGGLALDVFIPDGFVEFTDEFLVEVGADGSTQLYVFDGHANLFSAGDGTIVHVPPDRMVTVREGLVSDPEPFEARDLDRWWPGGLSTGFGGLATGLVVAGSCLVVLVGGPLVVWRVAQRRRKMPRSRGTMPRHKEGWAAPGSVATGAWGRLTVTQGRADPKIVSLEKPTLTIGRGSTSDLTLLDSLLSRRHAQIRRDGDAARLQDLASTNGTFVNGTRVAGSHDLRSGDRIRMGQTRLHFESDTVGRRLPTPRPRRIEAGPETKRVSLVLDRPVLTIGRGARSDLVLVDSRVSRGHARIRRDRGGTILQDLGSTNGTFLNGQRVRGSHPLRPGDVIRVGRTELVFGEQGVFPQGSGWRGRLALARGRADPGALALRAAGSKVRIGRSRRNDVVVADDPHVSRYHVEIRHTARGHEVVDLGAGAGVLVNGESVVRRVLRPGDRIRLGSTEFVYTE